MQWLKEVDLLYLDDFLKITAGKEPSAADIRIAHELLNHRYVARKRTIISSERYLNEIIDIDQATGGRIAERARGYTLNLQRTKAKDYRMKLAGELI
jgi:DNA replication protein DnaC